MSILPVLLYLNIIGTTIAVEPRELLYSDCKIEKLEGIVLEGCYKYDENMIIIGSNTVRKMDDVILHEFAHAYAYKRNTQQYYNGYGFKDEEDMADSFIGYYKGYNNKRYSYFDKYFPNFK